MVAAGSRGKVDQIRQVLATPLMAEDSQDRIIPIPITRSYVEGLDSQEYWAAGYGVRKGIVGRSYQTAKPGALAKELLASVSDVVVTSTKHEPAAITLPTDRADDISDRFLAAAAVGKNGKVLAKKGQLLTADMVPRLRKGGAKTVSVYTPLNSEAPGGGIPAKAFGLTERGTVPKPGDNVGILSGQAITEPLSQMTMRAFHSGGTIGAGANIPEGFDRVKQLLEFPHTVKGKATLAEEKGKVEKISKAPAGGYYVDVSGVSHYIPHGRNVTVKKGQRVASGDALSDGVIKPQELAEYKGLEETQKYMVDELQKSLKGTRRKYIETIVAGMTNRGRVIDPGDHADTVSYTHLTLPTTPYV